MGRVSSAELLREAATELYSADPDEFIERRGILVARARAAGEAPAAKQIAALRKPTRAAWVLNQLVRAAPGAAAELAELGEELRDAQRSLDGTAIRELSVRRRQLIDGLVRQAFTVSGLRSPPAALREEVAATLGAALADPEVAELLRAGALDRAARRDGLGLSGRPMLTVVPAPATSRATPARPATSRATPASPATSRVTPARPATSRATPARPAAARPAAVRAPTGRPAATAKPAPAKSAADVTALAAVRARTERERRSQAVADAQQVLAQADQAAGAAATAEREQELAVRLLEQQLADARHRLDDVRLHARRASAWQRRARQALDRLQKEPQ
jgi:hypothetical protein